MSGVVAGIGFRHATGADEIVSLIRQALAQAALPEGRLSAIATAADRAGEASAVTSAAAFGLRLHAVAGHDLAAADLRVETRSARIEDTRGIGSVAEAAALAVAGAGGRLLLTRIASAGATCALAESAPTTDSTS